MLILRLGWIIFFICKKRLDLLIITPTRIIMGNIKDTTIYKALNIKK